MTTLVFLCNDNTFPFSTNIHDISSKNKEKKMKLTSHVTTNKRLHRAQHVRRWR